MVIIIYGCPCSGKTTYVNSVAKESDIICDIDSLFNAISTNDEHAYNLYVHEIALNLHEELLKIISERSMEFSNAYVISTVNTKERLEKLKQKVNADECVFVDTPYSVCMERANERPYWFKYLIMEWFATTDLK